MSNFEEFGSPLPSYPTLPSPPTSDQQDLMSLLTDSTPGGSTLSSTPVESGSGFALPSEWGVTTEWGSSVTSSQSAVPPAPSSHFSSIATSGSDDMHSLNVSTTGTNSPSTDQHSNIPIYATVKKPVRSSFELQSNNPRHRTVSGSPLTDSIEAVNYSPHLGSSVQTPPTFPPADTTALRVKHLEDLCGKLSREKVEMKEDFGRQRKSFMNQMAFCDSQLSLTKKTVDKYSKELQELSKEVLTRDEELQNVTVAARITEASLREKFDADRVKYEEEIASLRIIVSVQSQDTNQAVQQEREVWKKENAGLRAELEQFQREGAMLSSLNISSPVDQRANKSPSPNSEDDDLELSMIKAAEDTKLLRSVVLPLEQEIHSLREKLSEAESKLSEAESRLAEGEAVVSVTDTSAPLIDFDASLTVGDVDRSHDFHSPLPQDSRELQGQLRLARSACSDLEMHTSQLNMQKNILQEEIKSLSEQLTAVSTDFEVEKLNCKELKETWKLANDHFIVSQDKLKQEIYRLHQKLERGEAVSPVREIVIEALPAPNIVERPHVQGGAGEATGEEEQTYTRTHRRSWSTDEVSEANILPAVLQRLKSASWSSLQKVEDTEDLSKRTQDLEEELSKVRAELKHQQSMCSNYEKQLPRVQQQMANELSDKETCIEKLKAENQKFQAHVVRQRIEFEKLVRQMDDLKEEMRTRIENFQSNEVELKSQQRILRDKFTEIKHDAQREIAKMSEDRREVFQQLGRSREEYDYLKAIQSSSVTDYQAQLADLKQKLEETEENLNRTTMHLNSTGEQLKSAREMLSAERLSKERINSTLNTQLDAAKRTIDKLSPLPSKLESEKSAKVEALSAKTEVERKSREVITGQQQQLEKMKEEKDKAENQVQELRRQVVSLKHKLNHTEETQKDFVELSQSLQMKLAVMEEEIQKNQEPPTSPST